MRGARNRARRLDESPDFNPQQPSPIPGLTDLVPIGGGASATVYQANEPAMHRRVAVKMLHALVRDASGRQAFEQECSLAGRVGEHAYAAEIFRSGFAGSRPYIVMRYYTRGSLTLRLAPAHRLTPGDSLTYCAQVATALQYAHNLGILHRDIKPENVLCDGFGSPVLADFGIATDRDDVTRTLRHAMTAAYAAPEVLRDGGGWPYSDVWSLAATLYALLAGHPPFYDLHRPDPRANMQAFVGPLPPIGRPDLPHHVEEMLTRALIGAPDTRTGSARRLAEELNTELQRLDLPCVPLRDPHDDTQSAMTPPSGQDTTGTGSGPSRLDATGSAGTTDRSRSAFAGGQTGPGEYPAESLSTGFLPTDSARRVPPPALPPRRRMPKAFIAAGAALVLVLAGLAYQLVKPKHGSAAHAGAATSAPATASSAPGRAVSATAPPPPTDVTAVPVTGSSAQISWKDAARAGTYKQVVISLGAGNPTRVVPDQSPQVVGGLTPGQAYCFAVGYVYDLQGRVSYSHRPACIRGGVPAGG